MEDLKSALNHRVEEVASLDAERIAVQRELKQLSLRGSLSLSAEEKESSSRELEGRLTELASLKADALEAVQEVRSSILEMQQLLELTVSTPNLNSQTQNGFGAVLVQSKSYAVPTDAPILRVTEKFDVTLFLDAFRRAMKGHSIPQASWPNMLLVKIADASLAKAYEDWLDLPGTQEVVKRGAAWDEVARW
jgi:hypothetical protein